MPVISNGSCEHVCLVLSCLISTVSEYNVQSYYTNIITTTTTFISYYYFYYYYYYYDWLPIL